MAVPWHSTLPEANESDAALGKITLDYWIRPIEYICIRRLELVYLFTVGRGPWQAPDAARHMAVCGSFFQVLFLCPGWQSVSAILDITSLSLTASFTNRLFTFDSLSISVFSQSTSLSDADRFQVSAYNPTRLACPILLTFDPIPFWLHHKPPRSAQTSINMPDELEVKDEHTEPQAEGGEEVSEDCAIRMRSR